MGESVTIRTGKMGHGKTLNAIREIDIQATKENRLVYYHNIDDLQPDKLKANWYEFDDPHEWFNLPENSIIVIDEAQRFFGVLDPRVKIPAYISELETIRHSGQEIVFITQDHRFLHVNIRRLCGSHIHFKRIMGSAKLARYQFIEASDYDRAAVLPNADKSIIKLDKSMYGVYKSATDHHFKLQIPKKVYLLIGMLLIAFFLLYRVFSGFLSKGADPQQDIDLTKDDSLGSVVSSMPLSLASSVVNSGANRESQPLSLDQYLELYKPRIEGLPHTAPAYDKLTEPQTYPKLSCVITESQDFINNNKGRIAVKTINKVKTGCSCYTQQASIYLVPFNVCQNIVENGYFDPAKPDDGNNVLRGANANLSASNNK